VERYESKFIVKLPAPWKTPLLPQQAHTILIGLLLMKDNGHVFCGSGMGLCKTRTTMAIHHIQHIINLMWARIRKDPAGHVSPEEYQEPAEDDNRTEEERREARICKVNQKMIDEFGFDCPCTKDNVAGRIPERPGVFVVLVPNGLLDVWEKEWRLAYGIKRGRKLPYDKNDFRQPLYMLAHGNARKEKGNLVERYMKSAHCKSYLDPEEVKANPAALPVCTPRLENSRCFIVTTSESWDTKFGLLSQFEDKVYEKREYPDIIDRKGNRKQVPSKIIHHVWHKLVINILVRDEVHLQNNADSYTTKLLRGKFIQSEQNKDIACIFHSGTLVCRGIPDLAWIIEPLIMLEKTQQLWQRHPVLHKLLDNSAVKKAKDWIQRLRNWNVPITREETEAHIKLIRPLIETLVVKFSPRDEFFDAGPVVPLKPNFYIELPCPNKPADVKALKEHRKRIDAEWEKEEADRKRKHEADKHKRNQPYIPRVREGQTLHYRERLYSSFPTLMKIVKKPETRERFQLTLKEWKEHQAAGLWDEKNLKDKPDIYLKFMEKISKSSSKLGMIRRLIQYFDTPLDGSKEKPRMAFCSFFAMGSRVVYLVSVGIFRL
jgi:hypothetical protein